MNSVQLVGRLTATPELRQTQSGIPNTRFTLAVDRRYQKKDEEKQADFINCVAWRQTAEFVCKYFSKGKRMGLTGSIVTGSYEKDGQKIWTTEIQADNVEFVESASSASPSVTVSDTATSGAESIIDAAGDGEVEDSNKNLPF